MATITIALTIRIILVDNKFGSTRKNFVCTLHTAADYLVGRPIVENYFVNRAALGSRNFGMGVIHVISSTICEDPIDEMHFNIGVQDVVKRESPSVSARMLVLKIPADGLLILTEVGID